MTDKKKTRLENIKSHPHALSLIIFTTICLILGGGLYWQKLQSRIYIEDAEITAPVVSITPKNTGVLEKIRVDAGDNIKKGKVVAEIGGKPLRSTVRGKVVYVDDAVGATVGPQNTLVKVTDPGDFRVQGRVEEDKGLSDIRPGQKVIFTVDAFDSTEYEAVVESVSEVPVQSDIVFSISDKRQEKEYNVKAKFDINSHPEFKNGMSARMWIYK